MKSGRGSGLGKLPKTLGFPFNISATAEASDYKFGMQLEFAKAIIKSHSEEKWAWPWARGASQNWGFPLIFVQRLKIATSKLVGWWGLPKPIIKSHPEEKKAWP